jgi:hypothetical protein
MNPLPRLLAFLVFLTALPQLHAQVELSGGKFALLASVTAGGGAMTEETVSVRSALGAPVANPSEGGRFTLTPGFDTLIVPLAGKSGVLKITGLPDGRGLLQWSDEAGDLVLESTSTPGPNAVWERVDVPEGVTHFETPPGLSLKFYRLRKP